MGAHCKQGGLRGLCSCLLLVLVLLQRCHLLLLLMQLVTLVLLLVVMVVWVLVLQLLVLLPVLFLHNSLLLSLMPRGPGGPRRAVQDLPPQHVQAVRRPEALRDRGRVLRHEALPLWLCCRDWRARPVLRRLLRRKCF